ncbi:helix-turn-helix domain-containing protein [Streptomyces sp. NPDC088923]|uniref:helix-turn-helix domain-containing protein n=1 Tax=Streptomyces sp. NPDC088923 TaxID=3365913 RepID=UPI00381D79A5
MDIGARVAEARSERGLTQEQLASALAMERSALAKIETGNRRISAVELVALARELGHRVEWFVEEPPPALTSYRNARRQAPREVIDTELTAFARHTEFVIAQGSTALVAGQPDPVPAPKTMEEAEALAHKVRLLLRLEKAQPLHDFAALAARLGLLILSTDLGEGADAGTVLLRRGGAAVVNGYWKVGRRRLSAAHELGHYVIADEFSLDWRIAAESHGLEARLDRFARALLMPAEDAARRWTQWLARTDETWRDATVRAASHYGVDMATLARRLLELGLVRNGQAHDIRQVRTNDADIIEKNLVVRPDLKPVSLPRVYEQAVLKLYRAESISAERALELLWGTIERDSLPELAPVPESEIWDAIS